MGNEGSEWKWTPWQWCGLWMRGEETACSYGTKLIQGLKICANLTKEVCIIQLPNVVFYFSLGIQKNKEQRGYCFPKAQCQARLMDQPYSFYSVGKIIQMNSSQPGQLTEYFVWNTLFFQIQSSFSHGCRQTDMWWEEGLDKSSSPFIICQGHSDVNSVIGQNKNLPQVLKK